MSVQTPPKQSWWRVFLTPGWVFFAIFVALFSYFAFTFLAPWQLGKDDDIVRRNNQIEAAYDRDPVPYDEALDSSGAIKEGDEWYRVSLTGRYLTDDETLLRLRPEEGTGPSYQSLVPFETTSSDELLVNRGWVAAGEANAVPEIAPAPAGDITIEGMVRKGEGVHPSAPITEQGYKQVYSINTGQVSQLTGTHLGEDYIQLSEGQPGVLNAMPVPQMDRGNHLSYGFQWIAFGIMAPLGLGYFVWAEIRERRRVVLEEAEMAGLIEPIVPTGPTGPALNDAPVAAQPAAPAPTSVASHEQSSTEKDSAEEAPTAEQPRRHRARYGDAKPDHYSKFSQRGRERF